MPTDLVRSNKYKLWSIIGSIVLLLSIAIYCARPKPIAMHAQPKSNLIKIDQEDNLEKWTLQSEDELNQLAKQHIQLEQRTQTQSKRLSDMQKVLQTHNKTLNNIQKDIVDFGKHLTSKFDQLSNQERTPKTQPDRQKQLRALANSFAPVPQPTSKNAKQKVPPEQWLPTGSFFKAILLNGIDAGTGSHTQANPQPVLMRIISNAWLPNFNHYLLKNCFALGSAYGSLSSQRAYIRTSQLSCVSQDGRFSISTKLPGYVVDQDGKLGLRGHVINRQTAKLTKAALAGFFGGLSSTIGQIKSQVATATSSSVNPLITPNTSLEHAGLSGANNAAKELAHFYINEAKRLFPIIAINAGRKVVINVSRGLSLHWKKTNQSDKPQLQTKEKTL